jgi:transcriptional regulator with XRE-family HTH domain
MPKKPRKNKELPLNRIKEALENQEKTQTWLAEQLDKDFVTVTRYANNHRQPALKIMFEIARILNLHPGELINDQHGRSKPHTYDKRIMASGKNLKKLREANGLTQEDLARSAGLSLATIQNFENGEMNPTLAIVYAFADVLNISAKELVE